MSKEIFVDNNRVLKLKNILEYTINLSNITEEDDLNKKIKTFDDYIKNHNLSSFGPLIVRTSIVSGDNPKVLMKVIKQIRDVNHKTNIPYQVLSELKTPNCVYSHFEGNQNDISIAQSKMQVYAYEHDLVLDTICYLVYLSQQDDEVKVDTFIPILGSTH